MRDVDQDAGSDPHESYDQGSKTTLGGIDKAVGEDSTTLMIFKMDLKDKILLHTIMVAREHDTFKDVLIELVREEARRIEDLTKITKEVLGEQNAPI